MKGEYVTIGKATIAQITSTDTTGIPQTTTIVNAKNLSYNNGKITVEQASLILEDFAITNEPRKYVTDFNEFTTEAAEMVYHRSVSTISRIHKYPAAFSDLRTHEPHE